jgi:hypothetical protein
MKKNKLQIGLLLNSNTVTAWFAKMVEQINSGQYADIKLIIINQPLEDTSLSLNKSKAHQKYGKIILNKVYHLLFERNQEVPDAFELIDIEKILPNILTIDTKNTFDKVTTNDEESDKTRIINSELDLLLHDGNAPLQKELLTTIKHGVWSYSIGEDPTNLNQPAGYWEMFKNKPETCVLLKRLTANLTQYQTLYRSYSATNYMSFIDNTNAVYWKALSFAPRKLEELYKDGGVQFERLVQQANEKPHYFSNEENLEPTTRQQLSLISKKIIQKLKLVCELKLFNKQWSLLYCIEPELSSSFTHYKKITPPNDRFWADPHVIYQNNTYYIFIEEYIYNEKKGHISVIKMNEKGEYQQPIPVLNKDHHLSYPFVFEHDGDYYMIPETAKNKTIELYKSSNFPFDWQWQMNLMENVTAVDTTLYFDNGKWWMFVNLVENDGASSLDELYLFYSDHFQSNQWHPHKKNPIVSDIKNARPAGAIFLMNNKVYRPAQNCSHRYGYGFNINRIERLNDIEFEEELITSVKPNWEKDLLATHTFSKVNRLHVIDGLRKKLKWPLASHLFTESDKKCANINK